MNDSHSRSLPSALIVLAFAVGLVVLCSASVVVVVLRHMPPEPADVGENEPATVGNVRVTVTGLRVDYPPVDDFGQSAVGEKKSLLVFLRIENTSASKRVRYEGWGDALRVQDKYAPRLEDNLANVYDRVQFDSGRKVAGQIEFQRIDPGTAADDLLVFEEPVANAEYLRLTLPASAVHEAGEFRFHIPARVIHR
jgi:hypothetical protein